MAPAIQLNGSLSTGVWSAFRNTLQVLDMAGAYNEEAEQGFTYNSLLPDC